MELGTSLGSVEGWGRVFRPALSSSGHWSSVLLIQPWILLAPALPSIGWEWGRGGLLKRAMVNLHPSLLSPRCLPDRGIPFLRNSMKC